MANYPPGFRSRRNKQVAEIRVETMPLKSERWNVKKKGCFACSKVKIFARFIHQQFKLPFFFAHFTFMSLSILESTGNLEALKHFGGFYLGNRSGPP